LARGGARPQFGLEAPQASAQVLGVTERPSRPLKK